MTTKGTIVFLALAFIACTNPALAGECKQKTFEYDSFVCVCNADDCDEIGETQQPGAGEYTVYTSSRDKDRMAVSSGSIDTQSDGSGKITVTTDEKFQTMIGFGGAFTDSTGLNLNKLSEPAKQNAIRAYFAPEGSGYNIGRVPIAGSDCSTRPYSYDDVEGDVELKNFALTSEDYDYKIPFIQEAMEMSPREIYIFGSPWSPPSWMKTNGMFNGSGTLKPEYWQPYSEYIVKFINAYEDDNNIPIWGLTPQNEPLSGFQDWGWNTCGWSAEDMTAWIKTNLGPTLQKAGLRRIKMMVDDFNRGTLPDYVKPIYADPDCSQYVDGTAVHWYDDRWVGPEVLQETHDLDPSKFILYTEGCEGFDIPGDGSVQLGSWPRGEEYLNNIIEDLNNWSTGWVDWNMALDMQGGPNWASNWLDSPIIVNYDDDEFYKQPTFYSLAHFSKFVERDGVKVGIESGITNVTSTAVVNPDGTIVVVALNRNEDDTPISINVDDTKFVNAKMPARSFQTYLISGQ